MVLAIDASRAAEEQKTGVGWYCYHLLANLKDVIPPDQRVILYSDQPLPVALRPWPERWEEQVLRWPPAFVFSPSRRSACGGSAVGGEGVGRWPLWSQLRLAGQVLRDRPDVLFIPAHVIPFALTSVPRTRRPRLVTTIHDVVFKQFPESYSWRERWYADHATRLAVCHADRIIVPTEAVKHDLERFYGCGPEKVTVIHHGVTLPVISTEPKRAEKSPSRLPGDLSTPLRSARDDGTMLLYVGRLEHKKNVIRIVEAFDRIAAQHPGIQLILAGPPGHGHGDVRAAIDRSPFRDRISTSGWVDDGQRDQLLRRAAVFLFPTLGEGFGLPILEAMAAGVPVVTSRGGAHEEVAGGAAVLVDPLDPRSIADATERVLNDQHFREDLVRRGQQRAAEFTWHRTAQQTWDVLSA
ncbi:MAG: glycosyltransferase family 1 protein [bacterium]|nr:glycosyltransferase family 1 protein [bacterium]